jgi:2-polyprenyl-3-methyl-5-hydroxy-6-metoxy-1,4-benzoquinol methylase
MEANSENIYTVENGDYYLKNPNWHTEDSPWKARQAYKMIFKNQLKPKTVVEIGCGAGEILNQLHQILPKETAFIGYDISIDAIKLAKSKEKERLTFKLENLIEQDVNYDLLLMMDVFEHVEDYISFLRKSKEKANFKLFHIPLDISVSSVLRNKIMVSRNLVGHLHYFTKETALATLKDSGYEILDYFYTAGSIDLPKTNIKTKLLKFPRQLLFSMNKDFAVNLLGGYSLLVLAK